MTWKSSVEIPPTEQEVYIDFTSSVLRLGGNKETGTVTISISLHDRHMSAQWANDMVSLLNEKVREQVSTEAERSIEYLKGELDNASSVELRQAINRLIEAQIQTIMLANVRRDFVFRVIDPAIAPDANRFVSPRRVLLAFLGLVFGGFVGLSFALTREALHSGGRASATTGS